MNTDIVSLENSDSKQKLTKRFSDTPFTPNFLDLQEFVNTNSHSTDGGILYVSAGKLAAVTELVQSSSLLFSLIICNSQEVLSRRDLIARCAAILVLPVDTATLIDAIAESRSSLDDPNALLALTMNFVGESSAVMDLMGVVDRVARYDAPVVIQGETGTGKELVARGIHYESMRRDAPFVPVNCGALTDELLLSELFGYEPGAFTDAKKQHVGLVTQASQGSLFLDEVDSLSVKAQTSLLRFMQDQEYRPLGSERVLRSDVRVICATNRDLQSMVRNKEFREDLYYRLKILDVDMPALRDRRSDIPMLIDHFLAEIAKRYDERPKRLHPVTEHWMCNDYHWPGNVRELENYLHRLFILSKGQSIYVPDIMGMPLYVKSGRRGKIASEAQQLGSFQEEKASHISRFERRYLASLMERTAGNISQAARISGKERRALGRLLKKHGIDSSSYRISSGIPH